ncbi:aldo/keto reductase [Rhizobium sp. CNPSo 3490]|uniref:aldo/keto reductase n=1 Tax=Rhizobium sp. CNPSo 3490 TaxID=3021407 RepID=UPI00254F5409|nr:aldo/keto reductase [Rhizobium sp. CNPSo 3490]MDK4736452.1 aldo/keto reductase [Rhizobium sp. CNPSo 3490]
MKLALGTAQFGLNYGIANSAGQISATEAVAILETAKASRIDTLDTAAAYGHSEASLGRAGVAEFKVVTKLPPMPSEVEKPDVWVRKQIEASLARLGVDSVYGYLMHRPEELAGRNGDAVASALQEAKQDGLVSRIGISIYDPRQIDLVSDRLDIGLVQAPLNLLDRRIVDSGKAKQLFERGIELHTRSAFLQGLLLFERDALPPAFQRWSALFDRWHDWLDTEQVAATKASLDFACSLSEVHRVVVGVDTQRQLSMLVAGLNKPGVNAGWPDLRTADLDLINPARWKLT